MEKLKQKFKGIGAGIAVSFAVSFLLAVYAPLELFVPGQNEFWFSLNSLIYPIISMFIALFAALLLIHIILKLLGNVCYYIGLSLSFAGLVILYIHGNFLVSKLPPMDGTSVNWSAHTAERIKSYAVIALVIAALIFVLIKFKKEIFNKAVLWGSVALSLLLTFTLSTLLLTTKIEDKSSDMLSTGYNQFEYSSDINLIVFCIDALDSQHFLNVLKDDPDFADVFDDFTYFDDTLAGYPFTRNAMSLIYSGTWYENGESYKDYCNNAVKNAPITKKLKKENYKIGLYQRDDFVLNNEICGGIFENYLDFAPKFASRLEAQKLIVKMAAVKYAPWDLKRYGYNVSEYSQNIKSLQQIEDSSTNYENYNFYYFVEQSNPITVTQEKCARFIHIEGAHVPFRYDKDVNVIESGSYQQNVAASITICKKYLERLKESGVYDNSAIVILGDHGFQTENIEDNDLTIRMNPALMIKGIGDRGEQMKIDSTPVSHKDLSQVFVKLIEKVPTNRLFSEFEYPNGRRFFEYEYLKEAHLVEYIANGKAYEIEKCKPTGKTYDLSK